MVCCRIDSGCSAQKALAIESAWHNREGLASDSKPVAVPALSLPSPLILKPSISQKILFKAVVRLCLDPFWYNASPQRRIKVQYET
jgi:hypothetical protein